MRFGAPWTKGNTHAILIFREEEPSAWFAEVPLGGSSELVWQNFWWEMPILGGARVCL